MVFESALVFDTGTAELMPEAQSILKEVTGLLVKLPSKYFVIVEGHSDSRPVTSGDFPSNWELSSARAAGVVRYFQEQGFPAKRMRAIGYADTQPLERVFDSARNRRVVIKVDSDSVWRTK